MCVRHLLASARCLIYLITACPAFTAVLLQNQAERLGVVDVQIGLTPLEEVYLHVVQDGVKVPNPSTTEG